MDLIWENLSKKIFKNEEELIKEVKDTAINQNFILIITAWRESRGTIDFACDQANSTNIKSKKDGSTITKDGILKYIIYRL
jgi:hypothetical protein